jgi:hypothetical protein
MGFWSADPGHLPRQYQRRDASSNSGASEGRCVFIVTIDSLMEGGGVCYCVFNLLQMTAMSVSRLLVRAMFARLHRNFAEQFNGKCGNEIRTVENGCHCRGRRS